MRQVLTAALAVSLAAGAFAEDAPPGPGPRHMRHPGPAGPPLEHMAQVLGLGDAQKAAWTDAVKAHHEAMKPVMEKVHALHQAAKAEVEKPDPQPAVVGEAVIAAHKAEAELKAAHSELHDKLMALLDAEQKAKFEAFRQSRPRMHGPGGPHGPGMMRRGPRPPLQ